MSRFTKETTAAEVGDAFANEIAGKTVLITGPSPGSLGAEAALEIAKHGAKLIILAGRSLEKLQKTADDIKAAAPSVETRLLTLNLASQSQIRKAAQEVNSYPESINVVLNSAGLMAIPFSKTEEGIEMQFGANHIGHFLFTNLIMSKILASGPGARVINVTSDGHKLGPVRFDDYNFKDGQDYNKWYSYGQAKSANTLFTRSLASKLGPKGLLSFSLHPGVISTNLGDHLGQDEDWDWVFNTLGKTFSPDIWRTHQQGTAPYLIAAFDPTIANANGSYFDQWQLSNEANAEWAKDPANADKLWTLSEQLVGQKFEY